jgi:uncharacterized protein with GYD domain
MATFVVLGSWTREGVRTYRETIHRADTLKETLEKLGVTLGHVYWTQGPYDVAFLLHSPDAETASAALLELDAQGNLRTTTLRAFDRTEMSAILEKVR